MRTYAVRRGAGAVAFDLRRGEQARGRGGGGERVCCRCRKPGRVTSRERGPERGCHVTGARVGGLYLGSAWRAVWL
jgi:hypothetical protein